MKKYEYQCVFIWWGAKKTTRILNDYGREGWELVAVEWNYVYLKRPLE